MLAQLEIRWNDYKTEIRQIKMGGQVQQKELHNIFLIGHPNDCEEDCSVTVYN